VATPRDALTSIGLAVAIDASTVSLCLALLIAYGRLRHSHPATIYLVFHLVVISARLVSLLFGASTLFAVWAVTFDPVTLEEIARAAMMADVALVMMTIAWLQAARADWRHAATRPPIAAATVTLAPSRIWLVVAVAMPIGIVGLVALARLPGIEGQQAELGVWGGSTWTAMTQTWAGLSLVGLIYWYGFRWWLVAPLVGYLFVESYQGYHRFRLILPVIFLTLVYLDRRQRTWPSWRLATLVLVLGLIFFPLKTIGQMAQGGASGSAITERAIDVVRAVVAGEHIDGLFLDQQAAALSLIDASGTVYYGSVYLPLLVVPVPRPWWPEKPGLAQHVFDISTPWRPMGPTGMVIGFLGEAYANFRLFGVVIIPYLLARALAAAHFRAYRSHYYSVARFAYLLIACTLIQVYRDGLISLVVFPVIYMMPLMAMVVLHVVAPARTGARTPPALDGRLVVEAGSSR
jgi:hypothetical protein